MRCPSCGKPSVVLRTNSQYGRIVRRRECDNSHRFSTAETYIQQDQVRMDTRAASAGGRGTHGAGKNA